MQGIAICLVIALGVANTCEADTSNDFILTSSSVVLPRLMPEIGNGYFATVTRSETIYVAGVFNGAGGDSHRARVPAALSFDVQLPNTSTTGNFTLNMLDGYFEHSVYAASYNVSHRQYAHRELLNVLVSEVIFVSDKSGTKEVTVNLENLSPIVDSEDLTLQELKSPIKSTRLFVGTTLMAEASNFPPQSVCFMFDVFPAQLLFNSSDATKSFKFIMTIAPSNDSQQCVNAYVQATQFSDTDLFERHRSAWHALWDSGSFRLSSDDASTYSFVKTVISGQYYLFSSLNTNTSRKLDANALAPGGLAHGGNNMDYRGHTFWDQETWMYPPILHLQSQLAARLLEYRVLRLGSAKRLANVTGYSGARFPWESAHTGLEVCPSWAIESNVEIHITGDIALAFLQYVYLTNDSGWYFSPVPPSNYTPFDTHLEIARFWASRVTPVNDSGVFYYAIYDVMPPDEYQGDVNNSVYTNKVASIALSAPFDCWTLTRPNDAPPAELVTYKRMSEQLLIIYDPLLNYHPEYEGYNIGQLVKQADAILIHYPLMHSGPDAGYSTVYNDVVLYERSTDASGPAMTLMMFAVIWLSLTTMPNVQQSQIDESIANANRLVGRSLPYIQAPFNVYTENVSGGGAVNFITGYGGYLQVFINGFLGLRVVRDRLDFNPILPANVKSMTFNNLDYRGSSFAVQVTAQVTIVNVTLLHTQLYLFFYTNRTSIPLRLGTPAIFSNQRFAISTIPSITTKMEWCQLLHRHGVFSASCSDVLPRSYDYLKLKRRSKNGLKFQSEPVLSSRLRHSNIL